ncbi:uncharacterized protein VTP21DRAFT_9913 [Calcarisporiella thermophila]|uniref:uncharacterized protein n=1 Tax=Calcarisporiella thermophila TaxID=911321 RepID=UPI003744A74C
MPTSTERTPLIGSHGTHSLDPTAQNTSYAPVDRGDAERGIGVVEEKGEAGFFSCTINLSNTILGTGMLAMPQAIASVGIIPGILLIIYSGFASGFGLYLLARCAARVNGRTSSFFSVARITFPRAQILIDSAIAIKCFGVGISYLIIIGDLMPGIMHAIMPELQLDSPMLGRRFWITVLMVVVAPVSFFRRLDSLKHTSVVALFAVAYLVLIVVYSFITPSESSKLPPAGEIDLVRFSTKFFTNLPIFVFAFTCHQNIFSVYNELRDNSPRSITKVISSAIGASTIIYEVVGILGYLTFGNTAPSNIISAYPASWLVTIGRISIVILVLFSFPLQCHPCRNSLDKIAYGLWSSPSVVSNKPPEPPSTQKHVLMTTGIILASYLISISVSQLDLVLSFVGATGSTTISFILPGIFYWRVHQNDPWRPKKILAVLLLLYGVLVMICCLTFNFMRLYRDPSESGIPSRLLYIIS